MTRLPIGVVRGLDACALPSGRFVLLSIDARNRLRDDLNPRDPAAVGDERMVEFKRTVVRALGRAVSGVLLDPETGAAQCVLDGSLPGHTGLVVALEATGYAGAATDRLSRRLDGWSAAKTRRLGADAAKVLVYYSAQAGRRGEQEAFLAEVASECREQELPLFVEVLVFASEGGDGISGAARTEAIIEASRRLSPLGGDVYMAQFPGDPARRDDAAWSDACADLDGACGLPWILLAGPADYETYEAQAAVATAAGASGVLAGKTVWGDALTRSPETAANELDATGLDRLRRLTSLVESQGTPWRSRMSRRIPEELADAWYRGY